MSGTLHVICSHSVSVVMCLCVGVWVCMFAREQKKRKEWKSKEKIVKKAAKFIVCYFQVSFWCRTVEYSVTVICDWVLFHSNLIYINSSIGIPFTTVGFLSTQKSNNSCLNSSPHSDLSYSNFSLLLSCLVLSLGLSNSHCITFSTKITQNKPSESGKTNAERSMVAVTRSVKIYFQTPWILAQYTFDFPLARFFFTHRVLMLVRVLSRFLSLSRSLSLFLFCCYLLWIF